MKNLTLLLITLLALVGGVTTASAQGVVKSRPGTQGLNDFWVREIIKHEYKQTVTANSDSVEYTVKAVPLYGSVYAATNDTLHRIAWAFENLTSDTLIVTIEKDVNTESKNTPLLADLAGYEPSAVTVNPGQSIHYYWTFGIYCQYAKVYVKVKAQSSNVSLLKGSKFRFYFIGF